MKFVNDINKEHTWTCLRNLGNDHVYCDDVAVRHSHLGDHYLEGAEAHRRFSKSVEGLDDYFLFPFRNPYQH